MSYKQGVKCYNKGATSNFDKRINSFDELPLTLTVDDMAAILGICKANAYSLCHFKDFPAVKIGKRLVIPKAAFLRWLENPKGG